MDKNKNDFHQYESYQPNQLQKIPPKSNRFAKINAWLERHNKLVLILLVVFIIIIGGTISYLFFNLKFQPITAESIKQADPKFYSPLTGLEVSEADSKRPVTAAMIENTPEARPQSGLADAGVVFESVAEGGITRLLALYQEGRPSSIGPIRSVRPHFASWVAAFDAGLAHVGGSDIALNKLRSGEIKDLDQFFNAAAYTRVSDRRAPHNVYSSNEKLQALNQKKGYNSSKFSSWKRRTKDTPSKSPDAQSINVPISTGQFTVSYTWNAANNTYTRTLGGTSHVDREGGQLTPKVVIILQVPHDVIRDSNNYSYPDVNGSGKAWLFQNGVVSELTWSKAGDKEQIKFTDTKGKTPELNPGQTWISAIKPDKTPTWQ